ncbi:type II toxin-antitoxin system RelE/ParE family toxin [Flavobacterium sp.]|uniref:type II toxin-antitoxin system RelE/ParE family toxin n=1 Tax=Flavobacterium sp. TaxID=239 RepID=UPI002605A9F7|nr:type II toxin-antitoxin system RelE/ParE family toxin [Flavobacterium sp.]
MRSILWSEPSKFDYWDNIDYLQREWTLTEVYAFIDKTNEVLDLLAKENLTFQPTNYKDTFQVPIIKQITLYYHINQNKDIELLRFWNNYQNPSKLRL